MTRRSRRTPLPPKLSTLIPLLIVIGVIWLYQNGYFERLLGVGTEAPALAEQAPETEDGAQPDGSKAPAPVLPQPSAPPVEAPPPQRSIDTQNLRGFSGAWYQVYFTKPSYPERAANRVGGLDETLVADINNARQRVEVAAFDFDVTSIAAALIRAKQRGLQVRVTIDGENLGAAEVAKVTGDLQNAGIPLFLDEREAFMHNKFIVIDDAVVWTGSANLTVNDLFRNNNNMLRIVEPKLAANYLAKADDLFSGNGGPRGGSVLINPTLPIGGARVITKFAPDDAITDDIVERINNAQQRIDMLAFAFTADPIADALIAARDRGVAVRGVMESRNVKGTGSEFAKMRDAAIDFQADGNCYIMHNKVVIIDGQTVITGSFNFTRAAQEANDENVLIIEDSSLAGRYTEEFERIYQQALQPPRCG